MEQIAADEEGGAGKDGADKGCRRRPQEGEQPPDAHDIEVEIHAQHEEIPLGEVDHAHHPEDEPET